ncbi:hypothetical protein K493DRAFT_313697 [Basidiobolus meristosporus CBS 931.73]|uniref:Mitochondrial import inner membrane translocase subunit n=1 Tax=Basidiobolus meristosporus CBS 931.73 TaxID=1314790 RepID=A0A1Y1YJQ5_9FUNG|nr:hypothetical protein K493DRAFT_313697 [Basidiobolus meristosporus CBS 931.73]|eukprot:ORX98267.1 hypothetical protein K493DRAFT_313697 [Basidiobolus meristosporus CBS 931.73]
MSQEFSEQDQRELAQFLEGENAKAKLQQSIHTFTDLCWDKCISKVGNKLDRSEEACLTNCVDRFLDTSLLIVKNLEEKRSSF